MHEHDYRRQSTCLRGAGHVWVCVADGTCAEPSVRAWRDPQNRGWSDVKLNWWDWNDRATAEQTAASLDRSHPPEERQR